MSKLDAVWSSKSDEWSTPKELFDELNKEFGFTLDPCSTDDNHLCDKYYTIQDNGLDQDWGGESVLREMKDGLYTRHEEYFPTAYDVDKVLDELMEGRYTYCGLFEYEEDLYKDGRFDAYKDAIEIVKRGGVK